MLAMVNLSPKAIKGNKGLGKDGHTHLDTLWAWASPRTWDARWSRETPSSSNTSNSQWAWSSLLNK